MSYLAAAATFLVTLQPLTGVGGGPQRIEVKAHDSNAARKLVEAQYKGAYRISDVRRINLR
jgi:hypothetical protein